MSKLAIHGGERTVPPGLEVHWPVITEEDKKAVLAVLERGIIWGAYAPEVKALQEEWAKYLGVKYCIALNSGTAALHCAVAAADVGPGDEVITSAFSFLASAVSILHHNAIPIFVDIDPKTFNIDVKKIEEKITERTKAIIPVDIHGLPADMDEINAIARKYNLVVIEDAAQAHGSQYKGRMAGSLGDMGIFSLNTTKNLPGGEGGLFVTNSEEYRGKANMTRIFGEYLTEGEGRSYKSYTMGWHYRTQEMPAAFARSQLKRLDRYNETARRNGQYLAEGLRAIRGVEPPYIPSDRTTNYHKYRVRLKPEELGLEIKPTEFRDKVMAALKAEGVSVALWQTFPLPANPLFQEMLGYGKGCPWSCPFYGKKIEYRTEDYPETVKLLDSSIVVAEESYPLYCQTEELMKYYVAAFEKVFSNIDEVLAIELAPREKVTIGRAELL
ncbi:MAG: DegT/DnrJ/EryC1/StrS family aminotransferase [Anaerolineae bacterium]